MPLSTTFHSRSVERLVAGRPTSDGAGVKLTRVLTQDLQQRLDPFLMLDNFGSDDPKDYGAGFPDHPHRGFETVTYMIAGRGVIHSEMPEQEEGVMEGFQLWLNLPAKNKMCPPWYRDIQSPAIPEFQNASGARARVIAGAASYPRSVFSSPLSISFFRSS